MDDIKQRLRDYILSEFLPGESPGNLGDDTPLITSGVLDSLATLSLVSFVEETFGVEIAAHEAGADRFDTIARIETLIVEKRGTTG